MSSLPIQVAQRDPGSPDFVTLLGEVLDPTNIPTATINVRTRSVPEPGSLALVVLGAVVLVGVHRRRRR